MDETVPVTSGSLQALWNVLPRGRTLSDEAWWPRHRAILVILWLHVLAIPLFALARGFSLGHSLSEGAVVMAAALVATSARPGRRIRGVAATLGLLTSSAIFVHLSGGVIEMHFHFFVMVPVVALYQDWLPFSAAIGYVLVQHGLMGALSPASVYNHPAAWRNPWRWAAIHALFIAGTSAVCLVTWRLNEAALAQRKRAEDDLRDALSVLTATLEATADGILVVNGEGKMTSFNRRFLEMWRIPDEVVASRDDEAALGYVLDQLTDPQGFLDKVRELYGTPDAESVDELEFKDGRVFERYSRPHRVAGVSAGRVWSFRDITERKRHEEALREALRRDHEAVERLEALDKAKNLFLTAVSHELRTPLSAVVGYAATLRERDEQLPRRRRREFLVRLEKNAQRLQRLLLNLFDLDRMSRGILEPRRQPTNVAALVWRVVENLDMASHPVTLDLRPAIAHVDRGMIERVVENLIANASKHTPAGTPLHVRLTAESGEVLIAVEDQGPGVPDDLKGLVFEPFQQGVTPSHSPGTGIGLSLVAQFVGLHGGRAWVQDRPGGGASFRVALPSAGESAITEELDREAAPSTRGS